MSRCQKCGNSLVIYPPLVIPTYVYCDTCTGSKPPVDVPIGQVSAASVDETRKDFSNIPPRALSRSSLARSTSGVIKILQ